MNDVTFGSSGKVTCKDLRNDERKRLRLCKNNSFIRSTCKVTCGECCRDDPDFTFNFKKFKQKNCGWLEDQPANTITKVCNDGEIGYGCIETCDACYSL